MRFSTLCVAFLLSAGPALATPFPQDDFGPPDAVVNGADALIPRQNGNGAGGMQTSKKKTTSTTKKTTSTSTTKKTTSTSVTAKSTTLTTAKTSTASVTSSTSTSKTTTAVSTSTAKTTTATSTSKSTTSTTATSTSATSKSTTSTSSSSSTSTSSTSKASTTSSSSANSSSSTSSSSSTTKSTSTSSTSSAAATCTGNTATTRSTWCDYNSSTDYYTTGPNTGVIREYYFNIENTTASPDGVSRLVQSINGTIPGPTLIGNWGDTFVVHVTNGVTYNGTSLHFHGIRQNYTNQMDGVNAITQCPTAPGDTITYTWRATQYGSSWYHSHYSLQAWDGVFGGIIINGPATANYNYDLGNLFLTDWSHKTADALYNYALTTGPPTLDTGLINGTNVYGTAGTRWSASVVSGSSYLLRVVNGAIDTHFDFSIDNHTLEVIAMDFVPIVPYTTKVLSIGMGQRYDVVVTANQASVASDFWLRAVPDIFCSDNDETANIKGIIHYGSSTGTPSTTAWAYTENDCYGEAAADLVPYLSKTALAGTSSSQEVTLGLSTTLLTRWYLADSTFYASWDSPTALQILDDVTAFTTEQNVMLAPTKDAWYSIIIETSASVAHPIHLHGHDFFILAKGTGTYESAAPTLDLSNPPRRDVEMLPAQGYMVMAFQADNPGVWLMHCHIGWHTEEGFSMQIIDQYASVAALYNETVLDNTCTKWTTYMTNAGRTQAEADDDGI